ncbi:hypothetical protein BJ508DRAFT_335565 [Ascobolus immersus RN42]|uniref:Uncharacterized protein n=1 Tax=Ascobolus immersus RN42 TaxID=1160509 RepID=A0A3N4HFI7_ASCIM|nr:hypothetical protein BJ508DRAFT_335565 [Ascobolus immersus RN42]
MSSFNKSNPTHGQAVRPDPHDRKLENSGPVAKDSLAAESLRSGGSFSKGNPTGISDVKGSQGTFAGHTLHDDIADIHRGKKPERMDIDGEESRKHHLHNSSTGISGVKQTRGSGESLSHEKNSEVAGPYSKPTPGSHGPEYVNILPTVGHTDIGTEKDAGRLALRAMEARNALPPGNNGTDHGMSGSGVNPYEALSSD